MRTIDRWRTFYSGIQTLFFGLSLGSVLVLIAIGLAITFGVMGVINMAHGELMMLGAYTTYVVQTADAAATSGSRSWWRFRRRLSWPGWRASLIERTHHPISLRQAAGDAARDLRREPHPAASGAVDFFGATTARSMTPDWMSGSLQLNDALSITYNRLYIVIFTLIVFSLILLVLKRTRIGLDIRAVSQNRAMAKAMGIRTEWVDAMTFGLGSGIAGVAGVALSQLTNVGPNLGQSYIIDSFMVVVFGGVGNLWGSLIGGMSHGHRQQTAGALRRAPCWQRFSSWSR